VDFAAEESMAERGEEINGQAAVASYVAALSHDLATMSRRSGLDTLGYLLEMVRLEAESLTRHNGANGRRSQG
jgi:hypothetical protein